VSPVTEVTSHGNNPGPDRGRRLDSRRVTIDGNDSVSGIERMLDRRFVKPNRNRDVLTFE